MDREVNHGHSGAWKVLPTSLSIRISGSNLRLEAVDVPKNLELACELGVGNLKPRPFVFPAGQQALDVPSDGKEYRINAAVMGSRSKHFCHLSLIGSSSPGSYRLSVHPACEQLCAEADGCLIYPQNGMMLLPMNATHCQLRPVLEKLDVGGAHAVADKILFDVTQGIDNVAPVLCFPNGDEFPVVVDGRSPLELTPSRSGVYRFKLPKSNAPLRTQQPVDVDIRTSRDHTGHTHLTVTARGFVVELSVDGHSTSAFGMCSALISTTRTSTVGITVSDAASRDVMLRETLAFPVTETAVHPVVCRIDDNAPGSARLLFTAPGGFVSVDHLEPVAGDRGVSVDCSVPRVIVVTQRNPDGSTSSANLNIGAKGASVDTKWVDDLASLLNDASRPSDQLLSALAAIRPPNASAQQVLQGVGRLLSRPPPMFDFAVSNGGSLLSGVSCPGFGVAAAHGNNAPCVIAPGGSVQLHTAQPTKISALDSRGSVAGAASLHLLQEAIKSAEEELLKAMLDAARASASPPELADRLTRVPTSSAVGQQLLPELARHLRSFAQSPSAPAAPPNAQDIMLQCNVERESGIALAVQVDANPSQALPANTPVPFSSLAKLLTLKVSRSSISSPYVQELIDAYKRAEPPQLSRRWAEQARPRDMPEEELHAILIALARDFEKLREGDMFRNAPPSGAAAISFVAGDGMLSNVRSEGYQLSAYVDDLPSIGVAQGGQIPQGVPFVTGAQHRVRIVARDSVGAIRGDVHTVVFGAKSNALQAGVGYVDASITAEKQQMKIKLTCPPGYKIHAEIDGKRGEASVSNEVAFLVDSVKPHVAVVNVSDGLGAVVFQQRLELPMLYQSNWGVSLKNNNLTVLSLLGTERGYTTTASIDMQAERVVDSAQIRLDHDMPHQVQLRKYFGEHSVPCGELLVKVSTFVDPDDTWAAAAALQSLPRGGGGDPLPALRDLQAIRDRTLSGILRKLLSELLDRFGGSEDAYYKKVTTSTMLNSAPGGAGAPSVFFRLRGDEERTASRK